MFQKDIKDDKNKKKYNFLKEIPCYLVENDANDLDVIKRFFEKSSKMLPQRNGSALTIGELMKCCAIIEEKQNIEVEEKVSFYIWYI